MCVAYILSVWSVTNLQHWHVPLLLFFRVSFLHHHVHRYIPGRRSRRRTTWVETQGAVCCILMCKMCIFASSCVREREGNITHAKHTYTNIHTIQTAASTESAAAFLHDLGWSLLPGLHFCEYLLPREYLLSQQNLKSQLLMKCAKSEATEFAIALKKKRVCDSADSNISQAKKSKSPCCLLLFLVSCSGCTAMYTYIYVCIYIRIFIYVYIHMCVCVCVCVCMYVCVHINI